MQINYLVECSSQRHMVVTKTLNPCKVNVNHMFVILELGIFLFPFLAGSKFKGSSGKVKKHADG